MTKTDQAKLTTTCPKCGAKIWAEFCDLLREALSLRNKTSKIGEMIYRAYQTLTVCEFDKLKEVFRSSGYGNTDIDVFLAVGMGKVDPRLVFEGVSSRKILALSPEDQNLLLSEPIEILTADGVISKSWESMSGAERNRIVGKDGILQPNQQKFSRRKKLK